MPLDKELTSDERKKDLAKAKTIFQKTILDDWKHKHYSHVVGLAKDYKGLITGFDIAAQLSQFILRESKELFDQRVKLTQSITPAVCEKIMSPFRKVPRVDNVTKRIDFTDEKEREDKRKELEKVLGSFYGDESLNDYLETNYIDLVFSDPNSFIVVEFDKFDNRTEKPNPRPWEVSSEQAINFQYLNNVLQWLLIALETSFKVKKTDSSETDTISAKQLFLYMRSDIIKLTEIPERVRVSQEKFRTAQVTETADLLFLIENAEKASEEILLWKIDKDKVYMVEFFQPKSKGNVQANRVGYKKDLITKNLTFVSPLQPALPRLKKTLKVVSELDLTMALHAFPQKMQYVEKCGGFPQKPCIKGYSHNQERCERCDGKGYVLHTSAQDAIIMPLPQDRENLLDLDKLMIYKTPPIDLITFQDKYEQNLEKECVKDVFASEAFNRSSVSVTATEKTIDMDSVNDTLFPFAKKYSSMYMFLGGLSAIFTDLSKGLVLVHAFPKDLKLKTVNQLLEDRKKAIDAQSPTFIVNEMDSDIAEKMFVDKPMSLQRYRVKRSHLPFIGKTFAEIQWIIMNNLATSRDKILWSNFDAIFSDIDNERMTSSQDDFYSLPFVDRLPILEEKIAQFELVIEDEQAVAVPFGEGGEGDPPEPEEG